MRKAIPRGWRLTQGIKTLQTIRKPRYRKGVRKPKWNVSRRGGRSGSRNVTSGSVDAVLAERFLPLAVKAVGGACPGGTSS